MDIHYLFIKVHPRVPTGLRAHDVISGVYKENFAGDGAGQGTTQEESGIANIALFDIAA